MSGPLPLDVIESMPVDLQELYFRLLDLHDIIRLRIEASLRAAPEFELANVAHAADGSGDVSFKLDVPGEEAVDAFFREHVELQPILVVAEGLGVRSYPEGMSDEARWIVVLDPVDGTRELSFEKRAAWILTGVARAGQNARLGSIELALQTELAPPIQSAWRQVGAYVGKGSWEVVAGLSRNGDQLARRLHSSGSPSVYGGWVNIVQLFPGAAGTMGDLTDRVFRRVFGVPASNEAQCFFDQYCSTGGQIWLLASGRYRGVFDARGILATAGLGPGLCAKPYDLSTWLLAAEAGAVISEGAAGGPLSFPLDTVTDCSWFGYANQSIRSELGPILHDELQRLADVR